MLQLVFAKKVQFCTHIPPGAAFSEGKFLIFTRKIPHFQTKNLSQSNISPTIFEAQNSLEYKSPSSPQIPPKRLFGQM